MVVLDTAKDWRFKHHPFVTGSPNIRFYAGAPLRTAEGFNVGSICIIDNQPRAEFPPRSRMALKEFAGVVIREMELWRDKVGIPLGFGGHISVVLTISCISV
jgi:GAF domain-containing protein